MWENLFRKDEHEQRLCKFLQNCYIFETLSLREIKFVRDNVHLRRYKAGEFIFRQGDIGVGLYIVTKGKIMIVVESDTTGNTESVPITTLDVGDFFGERALVDAAEKRTASAIASNEVECLGFFRPDLEEIIQRNPSTGIKIVMRLSEVLGRRLKETGQKITELKQQVLYIKSQKK